VISGDLDTVKLLVDKGAKLDAADVKGITPTKLAIDNHKNDIASYLISHGSMPMTLSLAVRFGSDQDISNQLSTGADINSFDDLGYSPLHYAAENGRVSAISLLLDKGAKIDILGSKYAVTPLWCAASAGQTSAVQALLDKGANISVTGQVSDPLTAAVQNGSVDIVNLLVSHGDSLSSGKGLLALAIKNSNKAMIGYLIQNNVNINAPDIMGETPVNCAVQSDNVDALTQLLNAGATVSAADVTAASRKATSDIFNLVFPKAQSNKSIKMFGGGSLNLLHNAARAGNADIVQTLLSNGGDVDINSKDAFGNTPLQYAVKGDHVDAAKDLLTNKADIKVKDSNKLSVLDYAVQGGDLQMAQLLLDNGADLSSDSTLDDAVSYSDSDIAKLLLSKGYKAPVIHANNQKAIQDILNSENPDAIDHFISDDPAITPHDAMSQLLQAEVEHHRSNVVRYLIQKDPSLSSIYSAAILGQEKSISDYIASTKDVNSGENTSQGTPLHAAVISGNLDVVNTLLNNGADVNAIDDADLTPLHVAVIEGQEPIVKTLIAHHAKIDAKDMIGATPLQGQHLLGTIS
jgi:ankyrin repeat protein